MLDFTLVTSPLTPLIAAEVLIGLLSSFDCCHRRGQLTLREPQRVGAERVPTSHLGLRGHIELTFQSINCKDLFPVRATGSFDG